MELHANLIDGDWVGGEAAPNINPANTAEVVGQYARATADDAAARDRGGQGGVPGLEPVGAAERHAVLRKAADEITRAQGRDRHACSRARRARPWPRASARRCGPRRSSTSSPARACACPASSLPSVRPGVGVEITREPVGPVGHHHALELPDRDPGLEDRAGARLGQHRRHQAGRPRAGLHLGDRRHPPPRRPAEGRAEPRHGQGLGRRPDDARQPRHQGDQLHRLGRHRPPRRRGERSS